MHDHQTPQHAVSLQFWTVALRTRPDWLIPLASLAAVNFFLGCVGVAQVSRIFMYRRSLEGSSVEAAKSLEHDVAGSAKSAVSEVEGAAKKSS